MDAETLSKAMGGTLSLDQYRRYLPEFENAMRAANITTVNRAAMWCAQIGHESLGLRYMEEIASGAAYEWRKDLGNNRAGDGKRFKGSGPIQLTGRANFTKFSRWCQQKGFTDNSNYIVNNPEVVRQNPRFGFLAASWYWTVERPSLNKQSDSRSILAATRSINGGLNGLADRRSRYNRCLALGSKLLPSKSSSSKPVSHTTSTKKKKTARETWLGKKIAVDGKLGPNTIKRLQAHVGTSIDGKLGPNSWKKIQKWVGTVQDGLKGPKTIAALQKKVGAKQDGIMGPNTIKKLQGWLNDHRR